MLQHVGLAADDAGGRTRRVEQHRIEGRCRPTTPADPRRRRPSAAPARPGAAARSRCARDRSRCASMSSAVRRKRTHRVRAGARPCRRVRRRHRARAHRAQVQAPRATSCADTSCTEAAPSAKPGNAATATGVSRRSASGKASSFVRFDAGVAQTSRGTPRAIAWRRLTRSHIGGSAALASSTASSSSGQSRAMCSRNHAGQCACTSPVGMPSRCARRSSALTSPAWWRRPSVRAASTVAATAACAGSCIGSSWAKPTNSNALSSLSRLRQRTRHPRRQRVFVAARAGATRRSRSPRPARGRAGRQLSATPPPVRP